MTHIRASFAALLLVTLLCSTARTQTIRNEEDQYPLTVFQLHLAANPTVYAGHYHYGFSEGESVLTLRVRGTAVTGECEYSRWNARRNAFDKVSVPLKNGKIVGCMLIADGWYGVFMQMSLMIKGLILFKAPTDAITPPEFGKRVYEGH